jgi:hypothetical protein
MNSFTKRLGLISYGLLSIVESVFNLIIYITHFDLIIKPLDFAMPFYFWYTNKYLKNTYIADLKQKHGQDI